jgi:diacylglycerol kinase (ATP)
MGQGQGDRLCLIHNPKAGRRSSQRQLEQLRRRFGDQLEVRGTTGPGVASEIARMAVEEGFAGVVAMGGDGTVHETATGLLNANRLNVPLIVCPAGSANDYAHSLVREFGESVRWPRITTSVDVGRVHGLSPRPAWFVNSLGLGFSARVTLESRRIRWLRGAWLYGLAALRAMTRYFDCHEWRVGIDGQPAEWRPVLMLSLLIGRREGNFLLAPRARMADGEFDFAIAGRLRRWDVIRLLPALALNGPPAGYRELATGRCHSLEIEAPMPIAAHVDGEILTRPEDDRRSARVELIPGRLPVSVL